MYNLKFWAIDSQGLWFFAFLISIVGFRISW